MTISLYWSLTVRWPSSVLSQKIWSPTADQRSLLSPIWSIRRYIRSGPCQILSRNLGSNLYGHLLPALLYYPSSLRHLKMSGRPTRLFVASTSDDQMIALRSSPPACPLPWSTAHVWLLRALHKGYTDTKWAFFRPTPPSLFVCYI